VELPSAKGFGSKLIRMGLLGTGGVEINYDPDGLRVTRRWFHSLSSDIEPKP